jgi:signal peptidase I
MTAEMQRTRSAASVSLRHAGAPAPIKGASVERSQSFAEGRFYVGLAGLIVSLTVIWMTLWAIVPALGWNWSTVVITSGSMAPTVAPGDVIVAAPHDGQGLGPGTVVVFLDAGRPGLVTHRIVSVNEDGTYQTKGDANRVNDSTPLTPQQIVGVGNLLVPLVGMPAMWVWSETWLNFGVWAAVMILAAWSARFALLEKYDPWKDDEAVQVSLKGRHRRSGRAFQRQTGRHRAPSRMTRVGRGTGDAHA